VPRIKIYSQKSVKILMFLAFTGTFFKYLGDDTIVTFESDDSVFFLSAFNTEINVFVRSVCVNVNASLSKQ
jgi:hypothetical protein